MPPAAGRFAVLASAVGNGGAFLSETVAWREDGLGVGLGIALFTFAAHAVCPEIRAATVAPRARFRAALDWAFLLVLVAFVLIAAAGYAGLGPDVRRPAVHDLVAGYSE
jgi:L-cystine uptake protein TcyP (sodium:dicarboxylate symporter family)